MLLGFGAIYPPEIALGSQRGRCGVDVMRRPSVRTRDALISGLIALVLAVPAVRAAESEAAPGAKVRVLVGSGAPGKEIWLAPGNGKSESFRDCPSCPEMVVVPAGEFVMGSPKDEPNRWAFSENQQKITFKRAFAAGKYAVTRGEFEAFVTVTRRAMTDKCEMPDGSMAAIPGGSWRSPGFKQTAQHPVVCVTNGDADAYAAWLSQKTGKKYRLIVDSGTGICGPCRHNIGVLVGGYDYPGSSKLRQSVAFRTRRTEGQANAGDAAGGRIQAQPLGPLSGSRQRGRVGGGLLG